MASREVEERPIRKGAIDQRVAILLGKKDSEVSLITAEFIREVREEIAKGREVCVDGLGRMKLYTRSGSRASHAILTGGTGGRSKGTKQYLVAIENKYYVSFKKAGPLEVAIRERYGPPGQGTVKVMEKYGVDEQQAEQEKKASDGCPECGAKVERHGNLLACPTHGTEPFENKRYPK